VVVPLGKHVSPCGINNTIIGHGVLEMFVWNRVVGVDHVSGFPNHDDAAEKSDQANSVKDSHESLGLVLETDQNDEEDHHHRDESGGGSNDRQPFHEIPDRIIKG
jgi:hypothetical protein